MFKVFNEDVPEFVLFSLFFDFKYSQHSILMFLLFGLYKELPVIIL